MQPVPHLNLLADVIWLELLKQLMLLQRLACIAYTTEAGIHAAASAAMPWLHMWPHCVHLAKLATAHHAQKLQEIRTTHIYIISLDTWARQMKQRRHATLSCAALALAT